MAYKRLICVILSNAGGKVLRVYRTHYKVGWNDESDIAQYLDLEYPLVSDGLLDLFDNDRTEK